MFLNQLIDVVAMSSIVVFHRFNIESDVFVLNFDCMRKLAFDFFICLASAVRRCAKQIFPLGINDLIQLARILFGPIKCAHALQF